MNPLKDMPKNVATAVRVVLADIDDTITSDGRLTADAYRALEDLKNAGLGVAPVTGRPAGWCDMIARFWPVDGVIGENGAFYYAYDGAKRKMIRKYHPALLTHLRNPGRFDVIKSRILREVPNAAISADQPFRQADLAVDFCEDVTALPNEEVVRIKEIFEEEGAVAKISSIHVNGWFGSYDKLSMSRDFLSDILSLDVDTNNAEIVFVGDSPNDAPMFGAFQNSCGVANVIAFKDTLTAAPTWVTRQPGGAGFVEIAERLLDAQQ